MTRKLTRRRNHFDDSALIGEINRLDANDAQLGAGLDALELLSMTQRFSNYTPEWKADSSNPAIVNGLLEGFYFKLGRLCFVHLSLIAGSSTTFGSGAWTFSLPFQSWDKPNGVGRIAAIGQAIMTDVSAPQWYAGACRVESNSSFVYVMGAAGKATSAYPFTWATTDKLELSLWYPLYGS